jgi:hypothetical protein
VAGGAAGRVEKRAVSLFHEASIDSRDDTDDDDVVNGGGEVVVAAALVVDSTEGVVVVLVASNGVGDAFVVSIERLDGRTLFVELRAELHDMAIGDREKCSTFAQTIYEKKEIQINTEHYLTHTLT